MMNKLKVPNYLLTLQSPVLAENTETICGVCHNLALTELIDAQYELSDAEVLEIARKKIFDFSYPFYYTKFSFKTLLETPQLSKKEPIPSPVFIKALFYHNLLY